MRAAAPPRGFERSEFVTRLAAAQAAMRKADMAGLFLMTEPEIRWFTGFLTPFWQSPTRPWFLFVPETGRPTAIIPEIGAALMARHDTCDIRTWPAPVPDDDGITLLIDLLGPLDKDGAALGVMMGHESQLRMPLADWHLLREALPHLRLSDATRLMQRLRMVKSPAEIEKIAHVCRLTSDSFDQVPQIATPGLPLEDLFRAFRIAGLQAGVDEVPYLVGGAGQGGYDDVISPPSIRPLSPGDLLMLDTGAMWDGYFSDFDRNWSLGPPDARVAEAHRILWDATEAGLAAASPGAAARDVFSAMQSVIAPHDDTGGDIGRLGHGLGMQLTEQPSLAAFDDTELAEGMVLTLEPSMTLGPGRMMVQEENIALTATGAQVLSRRAPRELPVID